MAKGRGNTTPSRKCRELGALANKRAADRHAIAMLVPIFGGAMAALIWVFLISAVAQLMD